MVASPRPFGQFNRGRNRHERNAAMQTRALTPIALTPLVALAMFLSGCEREDTGGPVEAASPASTAPAQPLNWETAQDDSKIAWGENDNYVIRCWSVSENQDCITAEGGPGRGVGVTAVRRTVSAELPVGNEALSGPAPTGYGCNIQNMEYEEFILGGRGPVKTHKTGEAYPGIEDSWTHEYVREFLQSNSINSSLKRFDCLKIYNVLQGNSLSALTTTELKYSSLGQY
jgi:hypothetical protein